MKKKMFLDLPPVNFWPITKVPKRKKLRMPSSSQINFRKSHKISFGRNYEDM